MAEVDMASAPDIIDPFKTAKFPVHLGESVTNPEPELHSTVYGVQYNHKPRQTVPTRTTAVLKSAGEPTAYNLLIHDGSADSKDRFKYKGRRRSRDSSYAFLFDSDKQAFTIERVQSSFNFNLTSASGGMREEYKQLDLGDGRESPADNVSGDDEDQPDPNNPYDFRHFVSAGSPDSLAPSMAPTPLARSPMPYSSPLTHSPEHTKRKPSERSGFQTRDAHLAVPKATPAKKPSAKKAAKKAAKKVEDDGGLILEMDEDEKPPKKRNLNFIERPASDGPISLREAARSSTPTSRTRIQPRRTRSRGLEPPPDEDVDDLSLPALAVQPPAVSIKPADDEQQDDDDHSAELEAELEHAFESAQEEDDAEEAGAVALGGTAGQHPQESDEESEEE